MGKPWPCRFGWHRWRRRSTEDGGSFLECARCHRVDDQDRRPPATPF